MCSGKCIKKETYGKNYNKPKLALSSLISKRRQNRRFKGASLYLDALLSNSISTIKFEVKQKKQRQSNDIKYSHISNTTNTVNDEEEIEKLCGIDSFFKELDTVKERKREKDSTKFIHDLDSEINAMLSDFIETGTV